MEFENGKSEKNTNKMFKNSTKLLRVFIARNLFPPLFVQLIFFQAVWHSMMAKHVSMMG